MKKAISLIMALMLILLSSYAETQAEEQRDDFSLRNFVDSFKEEQQPVYEIPTLEEFYTAYRLCSNRWGAFVNEEIDMVSLYDGCRVYIEDDLIIATEDADNGKVDNIMLAVADYDGGFLSPNKSAIHLMALIAALEYELPDNSSDWGKMATEISKTLDWWLCLLPLVDENGGIYDITERNPNASYNWYCGDYDTFYFEVKFEN